jgi:hypothetical protein
MPKSPSPESAEPKSELQKRLIAELDLLRRESDALHEAHRARVSTAIASLIELAAQEGPDESPRRAALEACRELLNKSRLKAERGKLRHLRELRRLLALLESSLS